MVASLAVCCTLCVFCICVTIEAGAIWGLRHSLKHVDIPVMPFWNIVWRPFYAVCFALGNKRFLKNRTFYRWLLSIGIGVAIYFMVAFLFGSDWPAAEDGFVGYVNAFWIASLLPLNIFLHRRWAVLDLKAAPAP
jgi:hypothetical protein